MQFVKKHYEKVILSLVLLMLAGTAFWLFLKISDKKAELDITLNPPGSSKKPAPIDLSVYEKALQRTKNPPMVDFSAPHHLFNSVTWKQKSDGTLVKILSQDMPRVVEIKPLNLIISYQGTSGTGESITGYKFGVTKEYAVRKQDRNMVQRYISATGKKDTDVFTLKEIQGPPNEPTGFVIELNDTKAQAVITAVQPFKRVEAYEADLKYELENKALNDLRVGSTITFGGDRYKVIAITENEVTVQADSNQKQTTIKWKPAS